MATEDERLISIDPTDPVGERLPQSARDEVVAVVGMRWRGVWQSGLDYSVSDVVQYEGSQYRCRTDHTLNVPDGSSDWELTSQGLALADDVGYDIVLIVGQSNAVGYVTGVSPINTTYLDPANERIMQWPSSGDYYGLGRPVQAVDPLFHVLAQTGTVGPGMPFARELLRRTKPNRKILLVPAARGSTGFTTTSLESPPAGYHTISGAGGWDPSGDQGGINLYEFAIAQANAAIASTPNNRVIACIWVQGEADAAYMTQSEYAAKLDELIDGFRSRITGAENMPFIIGQMVPERIKISSTYPNINAAHVDTPRRKLLTAFNYGAVGHYDGLSTPLHYDNEGQRINGMAMIGALDLALANKLGTDPVTPGAVSLTQVSTAVKASWVRTAGRVTDYNVRYRVNAGAWTALTRAQSLDAAATISGMTLGNTVDVQVQAVNEEGVSGWTDSATIALVKLPGQATLALGSPTAYTIPYTITAPTADGSHGAATSYLIEYKLHADSSWTPFATVTELTGSVTGLTDSTQYDVRATAINAAGSGSASTTQTVYTAAPTPLIDAVGVSAYRAWAVRKLRSAYAGSAIRVRYTDNSEADIGFATGTNNLDTAALLAGAAAHGGSAWIKTWYDQSGNGRDVTQSTAASQARIVNAGVLDVKNTRPSPVFASSIYLDTTNLGLYSAGAASALAVYSSTKGSNLGLAVERGSDPAYNLIGIHKSDGTLSIQIRDDTQAGMVATTGQVLPDATLVQVSAVDTGTVATNWINGIQCGTAAYTRSGHTMSETTTHVLGGATTSGSFLNGTMSELIEWTAALDDTQRAAGAANQKAYYGTA
ncbi:hypothetical protein B1R94_02405 [Mycolicibacterium litorale]|nr:hypothetical protein B1R94_02405 [Mycolicibacterium litorale]